MKMPIEINCPHCGAEAFLKREPLYNGLTKTGDELSCSACGFIFETEDDVPYKERENAPAIFTEADRSQKPDIFKEGENKNICRYCADYVVNPFMQYCSHHKKEIQSTDTCSDFKTSSEKAAKPLF